MNARISLSPENSGKPAAGINEPDIIISDITPFTTVDFPGRLAAVLYTQGCAWRCRYCYSSDFWSFDPAPSRISWGRVNQFLESRKGLLDGVVFCGGEPTAHAGLGRALAAVKEMGFQIGLHTSGMYPEKLKGLLALCDWVGMDVKAPFSRYERITRVPDSGERARESARLILESGVDHEFRTTVHPSLLSESDIMEIAHELADVGAQNFALQPFFPKGCSDQELNGYRMPSHWVSEPLSQFLNLRFKSFTIR